MTIQTQIERGETGARTNPHRRIAAHEVRHLCGDVSDMWLHRRLADSDFPKPIYIGRRRFWREADVIAWLDAQASEGAA